MSRKSAIKFTTLLCVCSGGAPSMIDITAGTVALLERVLGCPIFINHCIE